MRFHLVDRIENFEVGKSLRAIKHLTLAEEYLADHFPTFPVMPGVLQLQTLIEAGSWLMRLSEDFARSIWVLREARGVKYGTFVPPGHRLVLDVELIKTNGASATLKGRGAVDGQQAISAQVTLAAVSLRERGPDWADREQALQRQLRTHAEVLCGKLDEPRPRQDA